MATATNEIWINEDDQRRKLEGAELEAFLASRAQIAADLAILEQQKTAAAAAKQAVLDRLGLTADEAKLLVS